MHIANGDIYETRNDLIWYINKNNIPYLPLQKDSADLVLTKEVTDFLIKNNMFKIKEDDCLILTIPKGMYMEKIDNNRNDIKGECERFIMYETNIELSFPSIFTSDLMRVDLLKEMVLKGCAN